MMDLVKMILKDIVKTVNPMLVILYGQKLHVNTGDIKSMDFCIVTNIEKRSALHDLYLGIDYDFPITFKIYSEDEWEKLMNDEQSYAYLIRQKGTVLYDR